jgi:nicotinamidase-related amidase
VVDARLGRRADETLLVKKAASAFNGTPLADLLNSKGIRTLVVCGATTSGCIRATVVDACAAGFATLVAREAVGDRALGPHEASLFDIDAKYGDVVSAAEALDLLSRAGVAA